jgi:hypothetical protein
VRRADTLTALGKMQSVFLMVKQVVHVVAIALERANANPDTDSES